MMKTFKENNGLIAEFMGYKWVDDDAMWVKGEWPECTHMDKHLEYDTSWEWLMEVVEKIESLGYFVMINKWSSVYSGSETQRKNIASNFEDSKIVNTYKSVVQFIKWYNENKSNENNN